GLFERVRRDAYQKLYAEDVAYCRDFERVGRQVDAVAAGGARDVGAVVDEDARLAPARDLCGGRGQLEKDAAGQLLLAQLDERDTRFGGGADECEQAAELFGLRAGRATRLAARDEVRDRSRKRSGHPELAWVSSGE